MSTTCNECRRLFEHKQPPDYRYWAKMRYWSLDEAVLLLTGLEPLHRPQLGIEPHFGHTQQWDDIRRIRLAVRRARLPSGITGALDPEEIIRWGDTAEMPFPPQLKAAVMEYTASLNSVFSEQGHHTLRKRRPEADEREKNTLLRIVAGMMKCGYKHDPRLSSRSSVPKEIAGHVHSVGLQIDEDTVRKWLREAANLLPPPAEG